MFSEHLLTDGSLGKNFVIFDKAKDYEIKKYPFCLGNISGDLSADDMKKAGLNKCVHDFSVDYKTFDVSGTIDIHKHLMKKHDIK